VKFSPCVLVLAAFPEINNEKRGKGFKPRLGNPRFDPNYVIGLWGALIGVLSSRAKARRFVLGSANALRVIGIASHVGGAAAE
jgi:hypothetical protein